jgi:uncharacterized membrane protein YgdD (TMEM256/DUF423 family)
MYKPALKAAALFGALAVILGAFGAHALKSQLSAEMLQAYETGVKYQFYHTIAMLAIGIIYATYPEKSIKWAATLFTIGIILFSGSLYTMALMSIKGITLGPVGIITPIGGLFFIIGWILLFAGLIKK